MKKLHPLFLTGILLFASTHLLQHTSLFTLPASISEFFIGMSVSLLVVGGIAMGNGIRSCKNIRGKFHWGK